ncbi:MAG: ABC transporter permease [Chloroflexota bacterium]|nr:ABC transporter permease [Chloroflexota bacterium]
MVKFLARMMSFAGKELNEVRRQPRLIGSLILGPFLILLLFGVGYSTAQPPLHTVLVIPPASGMSRDASYYRHEFFQPPFQLDAILATEQEAQLWVQTDRADVALVVPPRPVDRILEGKQAGLKLMFNEIDPVQSTWIPYFSSVLVGEVNRRIVEEAVRNIQSDVRDLSSFQQELSRSLDEVQASMDRRDPQSTAAAAGRAEESVASVQSTVAAALAVAASSNVALGAQSTDQTQARLARSRQNLANLRARAEAGDADSAEQRQLLASTRAELNAAMPSVLRLSRVPPEVLAAPMKLDAVNFVRYQPTFIAFYGPGVLALLLQHLAVTLSSLSIVRERLLGALELFRVAPIGKTELFTGKYLGYGLITLLVGAALTASMYFLLGVPILGSLLYFALALVVLTFASLSLGFLISTLSRSESQAVQFSMILLLASIFFSGFFLPLSTLLVWVRAVSYALPVTYGLLTLQQVMLRGAVPELWLLAAPTGIGLVALFIATRLLKHDLARR